MLRRALDGRRRVLGPHHPSTIRTWDYLASALLAQDRLAEAASEYEAIVRELGDKSNPPFVSIRKTALQALATIAARRGDAATAGKWRHALDGTGPP